MCKERRVDMNLYLPFQPTDGRDLRHSGCGREDGSDAACLQFVELLEIPTETSVDKRVLINPSDARRVRADPDPSAGRNAGPYVRQAPLDLPAHGSGVRAIRQHGVDKDRKSTRLNS